jgi:peptidoglycan/LPS O-acetylase OafA/YrhL
MNRNSVCFTLTPGLFRICLAVAVVVAHSLPIKFGTTAVYLFFALSGFWIHTMWYAEYKKTVSPYITFVISRLWRLMPVYFLALTLFVAASIFWNQSSLGAFVSAEPDRLHFLLSNGFIFCMSRLPVGARLLKPAWSLDIEMQFYLLAPVILACLATSQRRIWSAIWIFISVLCAVYFLAEYEGGDAVSGYLPMYLVFFLAGVFVAHFQYNVSNSGSNASLLASTVFVLGVLSFHHTRPLFLEGSMTSPISFYEPLASFVLAILMLPYAMATVRVDVKTRGRFFKRYDRDLSNITYEVYLLHLSAFVVVDHYIAGLSHYKQMPFLLLTYVFIGVVSVTIYYQFDQPIDLRRRKFVKSRRLSNVTGAPVLAVKS